MNTFYIHTKTKLKGKPKQSNIVLMHKNSVAMNETLFLQPSFKSLNFVCINNDKKKMDEC